MQFSHVYCQALASDGGISSMPQSFEPPAVEGFVSRPSEEHDETFTDPWAMPRICIVRRE